MTTQFLHGVKVYEKNDGSRPIRYSNISTIGLIGTAPDANELEWPLNEPVLLLGPERKKLQALCKNGTLPDALDGIFDQIGARVIVVRVEEGSSLNQTISNVIGDRADSTGIHAFELAKPEHNEIPRILIAPGFTSIRPTGVLSIDLSDAGSNYTTAPTVTISGGGGQGAEAEATIVNNKIHSIKVTRFGFGYLAAPTVTISGGGGTGALATANIAACANPVVAEMLGYAERFRGVIIADGPNTNRSAALQYRQDWGSARVYVVDPGILVWDTELSMPVVQPSSDRVAGLIAKMDQENGPWWSPSNKILNGVIGIARPISFGISDFNSEANYLNENEVATVIREEGYRLWGNKTCSSDPLWKFLSVRRTHDLINDSVENAYLWALDRPFSVQLLVDVADSLMAFLRVLQARGATLGYKVWLDPKLNTKETMMDGKFWVDFDAEAPAPLENLNFTAHRNNKYYETLFKDAQKAIAANNNAA